MCVNGLHSSIQNAAAALLSSQARFQGCLGGWPMGFMFKKAACPVCHTAWHAVANTSKQVILSGRDQLETVIFYFRSFNAI